MQNSSNSARVPCNENHGLQTPGAGEPHVASRSRPVPARSQIARCPGTGRGEFMVGKNRATAVGTLVGALRCRTHMPTVVMADHVPNAVEKGMIGFPGQGASAGGDRTSVIRSVTVAGWACWRPGCRSGRAAGSRGRRLMQGTGVAVSPGRGQAASGQQMLIWAVAVRAGRPRGALGKAWRALVLWSRCRLRSTWTRRLPTAAITARQLAVMTWRGRLAVALPWRTAAIRVRRQAVNEISRGWTGWPARPPLAAGAARRAAARAVARTSSVAVTQAACSCWTRPGDCDRKISPAGARPR